MFYTNKVSYIFQYHPRTTHELWHFWGKMTINDVLLSYFEQIFTFCTPIQTNSSYFVKTSNVSSLNLANYIESVTFGFNSRKILLNPKFFYDPRDLFQVCVLLNWIKGDFEKKHKPAILPNTSNKIAINITFCNFSANLQPPTNRTALAWKKLSPACGTTCQNTLTFNNEKYFSLFAFLKSFFNPQKGKRRSCWCKTRLTYNCAHLRSTKEKKEENIWGRKIFFAEGMINGGGKGG